MLLCFVDRCKQIHSSENCTDVIVYRATGPSVMRWAKHGAVSAWDHSLSLGFFI